MNLNTKLKKCIDNQYKNKLNSYNYNYWQGEKYKLNDQIEETLPKAKKLAIYLYSKLYKENTSEMNKWISESPDFIHNWDGEVHKKYLDMATGLLNSHSYKTIKKMYNNGGIK